MGNNMGNLFLGINMGHFLLRKFIWETCLRNYYLFFFGKLTRETFFAEVNMGNFFEEMNMGHFFEEMNIGNFFENMNIGNFFSSFFD